MAFWVFGQMGNMEVLKYKLNLFSDLVLGLKALRIGGLS